MWSSVRESGSTPPRDTSPWLGLMANTPQNEAGRMIEPLVCEPIASGTIWAATAAAVPDEEPPGVRFESCGLRVLPGVRPEDVALWYGVIFMVNMQMAFLSPPFGYSLFYLKSVAPPEISMATIFRASVNFMVLQWIGVGLCIIFPQIILWLPNVIYAGH